ncbi:MAG: hypothetical protein HZB33_07050 [Nitrospirae bacterium]|nr:hypothetical protein [Nitrospirota bacterium]
MKNKNIYSNQVFINCPFDDEYKNIFHGICFAVFDCGFVPRCSFEVDDATESRLKEILRIIRECQYGIHDVSRVEIDRKTKLPRFNMPFELGLYFSSKVFGNKHHKKKKCLILDKTKYRYRKSISDLSGSDVSPHNNSIRAAIISVRDWLYTSSRRSTIPPGEDIVIRYIQYKKHITTVLNKRGREYNSIPFIEKTVYMTQWLRVNKLENTPLF